MFNIGKSMLFYDDSQINFNYLIQSTEMVCLMAERQGKTVLEILEPFNEYFKLAVPGNRLFHTYTFKSQIGIMKGHIFCALHCIPLEQFGGLFVS